MVFCVKLQRQGESLERAPFPGELGQKILDNISKEAWQQWLAQQTILINEYRLNPMDSQARKFLEEELQKYLFEGGADQPTPEQ